MPTKANQPNEEPPIESEATSWIQKNAILISSVNAGNGLNDLMPLKTIIGDAKIVAIGEAVYGTHETLLLKHRLLEFLIKEMNFKIIALPTDFPESELMNEYIQTGDGDVYAILVQLLWWRQKLKDNNIYLFTKEIQNMLNWLYTYNRQANPESKVKFCGYGVQRPQLAMRNVTDYLQSIDSTATHNADSLYSRFQSFCWRYPELNRYIMNDCRKRVETVRDSLKNRKDQYELFSSPQEYARALFFAEFVVKAEQVLRKNTQDLQNAYMVDMINYFFEQESANAKIVIWDHNLQIGNYNGGFGQLLKTEYNEELVTMGFSVSSGYFFASIPSPVDESYSLPCLLEVPSPIDGSYEKYFRSADIPMYILDIKSNINAPGSPETDWLYGPKKHLNIEMFYEPDKSDSYFKETNLNDVYDIMVFLQETNKAELLIYEFIN